MTSSLVSDDHTPGQAPGSVPAPASPLPESGSVPLRSRPVHVPAQPGEAPPADLLTHPDPEVAAQAAAVENLLRCWTRETDAPAPADGVLRIPLPASGTTLTAPVRYWSPTGWHRFGQPYLDGVPEPARPADAVTVAALLAREAAGGTAGDAADLVARVADSVRRTAAFIRDRREHPADASDVRHPLGHPADGSDVRDRLDHPADPSVPSVRSDPSVPSDRFLTAEQALLLGHPLHPTPKSREGLTEPEAQAYSPELRGSFPLHWLAVSPSVLATDSAWTERGRPVPAPRLTARLAPGPGPALPEDHAALPLHPWQLRQLLLRPEVTHLLDTGLLRDLGTHGAPWYPTSSVRTVHRTGAPVMLKLSLGLHITNSRRENHRKELHRGVEVHRLLRKGLSQQWRAAHPGFDIVRDPAWLAVDGPDGSPVRGLDVVIRHNPFSPSDDVCCVAALVAPRPGTAAGDPADGTGAPACAPASRLSGIITRLAAATGSPRSTVSAEWFLRYLEQVVRPILWLDGEAGIALEAHQQNTLLLLDAEGWPVGGRYRDNQGYYFRESRRADLDARLPGIGERSDTFVSDEVTDERFAYYLAVNNVLGLVGAFGSQRLADEGLLLSAFRRFLYEAAAGPRRLGGTLPARLLDTPVLRCKANLLTRLHGLDELAGPVDTQSVYVTISNPLHH